MRSTASHLVSVPAVSAEAFLVREHGGVQSLASANRISVLITEDQSEASIEIMWTNHSSVLLAPALALGTVAVGVALALGLVLAPRTLAQRLAWAHACKKPTNIF